MGNAKPNLNRWKIPFFALILTSELLAKSGNVGTPLPGSLRISDGNFSDGTSLDGNFRVDNRTGIPVAIYGVKSARYNGTPEQVARQYLRENASFLRIEDNLNDLRVAVIKNSIGGSYVGFRQYFNDVLVWGGKVVVSINRENQVEMIINQYKPGIQISTNPRINNSEALSIAKTAANGSNPEGNFSPTANLIVYNDENLTFTLAWEVVVFPIQSTGSWTIIVDAQDGVVLKKLNNALGYVNGEGRVFSPDPVSELRNTRLMDMDDSDETSLQAAYKIETLPNLDEAIAGKFRIKGRYSRSVQNMGPDPELAQESSAHNFKYTRDDDRFEEVNTYFHIDKMRQYIGTLGITSPQWNGYDWISFDAHAYDVEDWSSYDTRLKMLNFGDGGIDDAEDQDVIIHEYGHALHDAYLMMGLRGEETSYDTRAISEGIGDYLALSYRLSLGSDFQPKKVFPWDGNGEFWQGRSLSATARYSDWIGMDDIWTDGTIWAATLMDMQNHPSITRDVTNALVLESLMALTEKSLVSDYVQAILTKDYGLYGGIHVVPITNVFLKRGFPVSWQKDVLVKEDVIVPSGSILTIRPGIVVRFVAHSDENNGGNDPGRSEFVVSGTLDASSDGIVFQSNSPSPTKGDWYGIRVETGGLADLSGAKIIHPAHCGQTFESDGIRLSAKTTFEHCGLVLELSSNPFACGLLTATGSGHSGTISNERWEWQYKAGDKGPWVNVSPPWEFWRSTSPYPALTTYSLSESDIGHTFRVTLRYLDEFQLYNFAQSPKSEIVGPGFPLAPAFGQVITGNQVVELLWGEPESCGAPLNGYHVKISPNGVGLQHPQNLTPDGWIRNKKRGNLSNLD